MTTKSKQKTKSSPRQVQESNPSSEALASKGHDLRQGLIVYVFAMAVIVAMGIYLYQRVQALDSQYTKILEEQSQSRQS